MSSRARRTDWRTTPFHAMKMRSSGPRIHRATRARLASSRVISLSQRICSTFWRTDSCASPSRCASERFDWRSLTASRSSPPPGVLSPGGELVLFSVVGGAVPRGTGVWTCCHHSEPAGEADGLGR